MSRYVISLGGNALGNNPQEQKELLKKVAIPIVDLIKNGHEVAIVHGNGPQVGMINLAFSEAKSTPDMPFAECGAMSQGYIGWHLQNAIQNELKKQKLTKEVVSLVTQVLVNEDDKGFKNPTKPVGAFYSEQESKIQTQQKGYVMKEDSGRGYRRVVASPTPIDVIEKNTIKTLVKSGSVVICAGGGGIPVIKKLDQLHGIAAVIDKDFASAKVAELIHADYLVILTAVDYVYVDFNTPNQKALKEMTISTLTPYLNDNQFAKGSMWPKVKACVDFVEKTKNTAVISSLEDAVKAFELKIGTIIKP